MFTHTITIGRNVGSTPMSDISWLTFERVVHDALWTAAHTSHGAAEISVRKGEGAWEDEPENSITVTALSPERMPHYRLLELKGRLALFCREYKQDAIALSVNVQAELITFERDSGI